MQMKDNEYTQQAEAFLKKHGIKFRATLSDTKSPQWGDDDSKHGHHYRVTLSKKRPIYRLYEEIAEHPKFVARITFDFWGSIKDMEDGNTEVTAYDVLACISGDVYTPETFKEFCAEFGYDKDSIKALQQFRRCDRFAKRLRAFFTDSEIKDLSEIR